MLRSISDGGGCLFWFADSKDVYVQSRCSPVPVGVVQDLSPSRVVAASTGHARDVVVTTTHLPMAMAGPWTVRIPTHGRCHAHVVRCHATARGVDAS